MRRTWAHASGASPATHTREDTMKNTSTPWGAPQSARQIAVGIVKYSTASHGGIHLTAARIAAMPEALRGIAPCSQRF